MGEKYKQKVGRWGEDLAARFLVKKGFEIKVRNYRTKLGEIDIVAEIGNELVFVEVKTRTTQNFGYGEEAVSFKKQQRLRCAIEQFLWQKPTSRDVRVDVVVVELFGPQPEFKHFENIELA